MAPRIVARLKRTIIHEHACVALHRAWVANCRFQVHLQVWSGVRRGSYPCFTAQEIRKRGKRTFWIHRLPNLRQEHGICYTAFNDPRNDENKLPLFPYVILLHGRTSAAHRGQTGAWEDVFSISFLFPCFSCSCCYLPARLLIPPVLSLVHSSLPPLLAASKPLVPLIMILQNFCCDFYLPKFAFGLPCDVSTRSSVLPRFFLLSDVVGECVRTARNDLAVYRQM